MFGRKKVADLQSRLAVLEEEPPLLHALSKLTTTAKAPKVQSLFIIFNLYIHPLIQ
mgnify:CR=1 FL=1